MADKCNDTCYLHDEQCKRITHLDEWLNGKEPEEGFKAKWSVAEHKLDMIYKVMWAIIYGVGGVLGIAVLALVLKVKL